MNDNKNQLKPVDSVCQMLRGKGAKGKIEALLPSDIKYEDFRNTCLYVLPKAYLGNYGAADIFEAILDSARAGLVPDGNKGAIVKFGNKVQFVPMIAGLFDVASKNGVKSWSLHIRYENDDWHYGTNEEGLIRIRWGMADGERGEPLGAFSIAQMDDLSIHHLYMPKCDIIKIKEASLQKIKDKDNQKYSPWIAWEMSMWKKSVGRLAFKDLPLAGGRERIKRIMDAHDNNVGIGFENARVINPNQTKPAQSQAERLGGKVATAEADVVNDDNNDNSGAMSGFGEDGKGDNNGNS